MERTGSPMGQKVHPEILRVGYIHDWKSTWFNEREFADYLLEDIRIREHIENKLAHAGLSDITIRKDTNEVEVNINTARPGIVIGKSGTEVDALRRELHRMTRKSVKVNILEIKPSGFAQDLTQIEAPQQMPTGGDGRGGRDRGRGGGPPRGRRESGGGGGQQSGGPPSTGS